MSDRAASGVVVVVVCVLVRLCVGGRSVVARARAVGGAWRHHDATETEKENVKSMMIPVHVINCIIRSSTVPFLLTRTSRSMPYCNIDSRDFQGNIHYIYKAVDLL